VHALVLIGHAASLTPYKSDTPPLHHFVMAPAALPQPTLPQPETNAAAKACGRKWESTGIAMQAPAGALLVLIVAGYLEPAQGSRRCASGWDKGRPEPLFVLNARGTPTAVIGLGLSYDFIRFFFSLITPRAWYCNMLLHMNVHVHVHVQWEKLKNRYKYFLKKM